MSPRVFVVAGPPGSGKSTAFPVSGFGVDFFNSDDRAVALNGGAYLDIPRVIRGQVNQLFEADGFERLSKSEQLATVQRRVRKHYDKTGGKCGGFGEILQYRFADTFDTGIVLETNGNVVKEHSERFPLPEVRLALH